MCVCTMDVWRKTYDVEKHLALLLPAIHTHITQQIVCYVIHNVVMCRSSKPPCIQILQGEKMQHMQKPPLAKI